MEKVFDDNRIWLDSTGTVTGIVDGKPGYYLGIRPESSAAARPGDDILLTLGIRSEGDIKAFNFTYKKPDGTNESSPAEVTLGEADYLAVYDKKMLWRANLYIDEGNADWNNVHPWNAPPAANARPNAENPSWGRLPAAQDSGWDEVRWGCNEWNRKYEGTTAFNSIDALSASDGKQVVTMPTTRWWEKANEDLNQRNEKKLAYDYWGWDSPFSFTKKIFEQKLILNQWYTAQGLRFLKPISEWRSGDPNSWTTHTGQVMAESDKITLLKGFLPNANEYQASGVSFSSLRSTFLRFRDTSSNRWNNTQSPAETTNPMRHTRNHARGPDYDKYDTWFNGALLGGAFELESMPGTINGIELHPYIPGLSNELHYGRETDGTRYLQQFAAGADCIGFVQGSLSYSGVTYQAMTAATRKVVPSYWDTIGTKAANSAMNDLNSAQSILITNKKNIVDDGLVAELDKIVPGDIFYYFNNGGHHIAVVAEIDQGLFFFDVLANNLQAIKIIESTHNITLDLFGVGNTSTLDDYSGDVDRPWQIRRMK